MAIGKGKTRVTFTISVDEDIRLIEYLDAIGDQTDQTRSQLIRRALRFALDPTNIQLFLRFSPIQQTSQSSGQGE